MIKHKRPLILIVCILVSCLLLCGCTKKIELSQGVFTDDSTHISSLVTAEDIALLDSFYQLQSADFSGSLCYDEIIAWAQSQPQVKVTYTVTLPDGQQLLPNVEALDMSPMNGSQLDESFELLKYFPAVKSISLPEHVSLEQLAKLSSLCPEAQLNFSTSVSGMSISSDTSTLNFSSKTAADSQAILPWLAYMPQLEKVDFGEENGTFNWDDIHAYRAARPDIKIDYSFELYGKNFTLDEKKMDLNHIRIDDEGALVKKVAACMNNLEFLDMDTCGVSDEAMAEIRDSLPNTEVVWRIWFGEKYSVRTNVEKILASNPGIGGELTAENTRSLKYCTKIKHLDVGHNSFLSDISFVEFMPNLEVLIVAMDNWSDVSSLAKCPKLEYAELQTSCLNDLRPLSGLKNLKHLNISYCVALTDISPLYELTQLERLWVGCLTPIPKEQIDRFKELVPQCEVDTSTLDPTEGGWRYSQTQFGLKAHPRYELLRDQFEYQLGNDAYAYYFNDPLY